MSVDGVRGVWKWARSRSRLCLISAFSSWWLWTWVWVSGDWSSYRTMMLYAASLVVFGAAATAIAYRFRGLVSVVLALSPALVMPAAYAVDATLDYARGDARLWVGGMFSLSGPYDRIDLDTRIPLHPFGCTGAPLHAPIHNGVLRALAWVAPAPGTFHGVLPTDREVRGALADSGIDLRQACRDDVLVIDGRDEPLGSHLEWVCRPQLSGNGEPLGQRVVSLGDGLVAIEAPFGRHYRAEAPGGCVRSSLPCRVLVLHLPSEILLGHPPNDDDLAKAWKREDRRRRGLPEPGLAEQYEMLKRSSNREWDSATPP